MTFRDFHSHCIPAMMSFRDPINLALNDNIFNVYTLSITTVGFLSFSVTYRQLGLLLFCDLILSILYLMGPSELDCDQRK